jgi:hypothetical protein
MSACFRAGTVLDGPGADTVYGGLGNDTVVLVKDGTPDTVHRGVGHDVVYGATAATPLPPTANRSLSGSRIAVRSGRPAPVADVTQTEPPTPIAEVGGCLAS